MLVGIVHTRVITEKRENSRQIEKHARLAFTASCEGAKTDDDSTRTHTL